MVGGTNDRQTYYGSVWSFLFTGGTTWVQQGNKIYPNDGATQPMFGSNVSLSSNGNIALICGSQDNMADGAVWLYKRSGAVWTKQGAKTAVVTTPSLFEFYCSGGAISSDGTTAVVGAYGDASGGIRRQRQRLKEGSRGKLVAALEALQSTGQSVLDDLAQTRTDTLLRFEQGLGALNSRRQRAFRLPSSDIAARFIVSDLLDVDQTTTSATLRAASQAVTLRERNRPASPAIQSQKFSTSAGMTEQFNGMYRVTTTDGSTPT